jgi:hypothetical protein
MNTLNVDDTVFSSRRNGKREKTGRKTLADLRRGVCERFDSALLERLRLAGRLTSFLQDEVNLESADTDRHSLAVLLPRREAAVAQRCDGGLAKTM